MPTITYPTRIHTSATLIDNIFYKPSLCNRSAKSGIILTSISDHLPCFLCIETEKNKLKYPKYIKIQTYNTDALDNFTKAIEESNISAHLNNDDFSNPNDNYNELINIITECKDTFLPCRTVKFNKKKHKVSPWISAGIIRSINFRDKLYKELKLCPHISTEYNTKKNNLKVFNSILKKIIRNAKKMYYESQFEKHKNDTRKTWGLINTILNKKKTVKELPEFFKIRNRQITNKQEIAQEFNHFFANIGEELADKIQGPPNRSFKDFLKQNIECKFNFQPITSNDVLISISKLPSKTSSGYDNLSNKVLKHIKNLVCEPLALIINQSFKTGIFPDKLKLAKVFPAFKKEEDFIFTNYRPISLLSVFSKVFEKIAYVQFFKYLSDNNLLYKGQHGFRVDHSTETALYELLDKINFSLDNHKLSLCTFIDLSKAFDTLDHSILIHKLSYYGVSGVSLNWFSSYLNNRLQYTIYSDSCSSTLPLNTGVPQGSILGPLLFLVYINDICSASDDVDMILYADDTTIIKTLDPSSLVNDIENLNSELSKVHSWLLLNKLSLNIKKTGYMIFHFSQRTLNFDTLPDVCINNEKVTRFENFDFLGVILHPQLSWKHHLSKISIKIARTNGLIKRLQHTLPTYILKNIYNSLILPHLLYGVLCWGHSASRITRLQKKSIRNLTKSKYNSHTEPLFKENNILKLEDLLKVKALQFYYKYIHKTTPFYFNHMFQPAVQRTVYHTRYSNLPLLQQPNRVSCLKTIRYTIPNILGKFPPIVTDKINTHSYYGFSQYVKTFLINTYKYECNIVNCFICSI